MSTPILNTLTPFRSHAIQRIRVNVVFLLGFALVTYLLPSSIPGLLTSVQFVASRNSTTWDRNIWFKGLAWFETALALMCGYNIVDSILGLVYTRKPLPPAAPPRDSPAKAKTPATNRTRSLLGPQSAKSSSPLPLPSSPFTPSKSLSKSLSMSTAYKSSPPTTPSRVIHYTPLTSLASSANTSAPDTPSPMAVYRGRHQESNGFPGRALDGSFLESLGGLDSDK